PAKSSCMPFLKKSKKGHCEAHRAEGSTPGTKACAECAFLALSPISLVSPVRRTFPFFRDVLLTHS
ncbi:MAG TPA: hypothetical protein VJ206_02685, partial [bacterium]|nr:hypothetical protein [bacterium]